MCLTELEPTTQGLGIPCSIPIYKYLDMARPEGFEPPDLWIRSLPLYPLSYGRTNDSNPYYNKPFYFINVKYNPLNLDYRGDLIRQRLRDLLQPWQKHLTCSLYNTAGFLIIFIG